MLSIYVGKAGGIGPAREIAEFAESAGLACTIGSNLEMGIGSAAMIHLALATRGITADTYACDIIGPLFYEDDVLGRAAAAETRRGAGRRKDRGWASSSTTRKSSGTASGETARRVHPSTRSIRSSCGPSHRARRHALAKSTQSYFQSPGMRANRQQCVGTPSGPRRTTPRL